uniref:Uncharacterized protein n=1 Tax=Panagrolaimus sp. PS1159 TaxID=55785 RepID=A0AC35EW91_9BILA
MLNPQIRFFTEFFNLDLPADFIEELEHLNEITLENRLTENPPNIFEYRDIPQEIQDALYALLSEYRKIYEFWE